MNDIANPKEKLAFSEYKKLIVLVRQQSNLFLELGYTLKRIREMRLFKLIGDGGFETWGRFLAQPEIGIKPSTAYFYIQIFEEYVERLKMSKDEIADSPFYKLQKLLPIIRKEQPERAIEIIDEMMPLGANDFNAEIQKRKGVTESDTPPAVKRCETCNGWVLLVTNENKCHCHDSIEKKTLQSST